MNNIILVLSSYVCFISLQFIANFELFGVLLTCPSLRGAFAPKNRLYFTIVANVMYRNSVQHSTNVDLYANKLVCTNKLVITITNL